jgi:hypothetical protein
MSRERRLRQIIKDRVLVPNADIVEAAATENDHVHIWVVFSTALADSWLMLQCVECGLHGVVKDSSKEEWSKAFRAPSRPYRWNDDARVVVQPQVPRNPPYVIQSEHGPECECYSERNQLRPEEFERFPRESVRPVILMNDEERQELIAIADIVIKGKLCSFLFEFYLDCFARDTGETPGIAVRDVAHRLKNLDQMGLHCSPVVVAKVLLAIADPKPRTNAE